MSNVIQYSVRGYEVIEQIGKGGFGEVYRAIQLEVDREVALKVIRPEFANLPNFVRRFQAEARVAGSLEHPHIIPVYDYWRSPDGAFFVMRYLRGGSLRDRIANRQLTVKQVVEIFDHIASAVAFAHRNDVIHCDLKPSNVLFDSTDHVYLTDFGIARTIHNNDTNGHVSGSPIYISPEQILREEITPKSDIYSLGIMLFEMLTGQHPFADCKTVEEIFDKHLYGTLPPIHRFVPGLPSSLDDVLATATAKNPALRYLDALQMAMTFRQVIKPVNPDLPLDSVIEVNNFIEVDTLQIPTDSTMVFETVAVELRNPYKGLRAFNVEDAADFFGRGGLVQQLANRLQINTPFSNFLALVGPSGMGKSSVIRAGLIPAIRKGQLIEGSDSWFITDMVPDQDPLDALQTALWRIAVQDSDQIADHLCSSDDGLTVATQAILPPQGEMLLFIDQFEELFANENDSETIQRFLMLIHSAVVNPDSCIKVIIALRADYYDRPLNFSEFSELLRARSEVIGPLTIDELELAITEPLRELGVAFEQGLAAAIITDVYQQPGALPMLQYTLTELFDRREDRTMTADAYHMIGGVLGALTRKAEEVFTSLSEDHQEVAKKLFLRLVALGDGADDSRRRAHLSELLALDPEAMSSVIKSFGDARLLTFDRDSASRETTIEVAHEAIIRQWERLRTWIDDFRDDFRQFRLFRSAFEQWVANDKDESFLLVGTRLDRFNEWHRATAVVLGEALQSFLDTSNQYQILQANQEAARQQQVIDLRRAAMSRLRQVVLALILGLTVAIALLGVVIRENRNTDRARENADAARQTSDANAAIAMTQAYIAESLTNETRALLIATAARNALLSDNPDLAIALALEAVEIDPTSTEAYQILTDIAYQPNTRIRLEGHSTSISAITLSPDGNLMITGTSYPQNLNPSSGPNSMILWDTNTGQQLHNFSDVTVGINDIIMNADGTIAYSAHQNGTVVVWALPNGEELARIQTEGVAVKALVLSPDGNTLIASEELLHDDKIVGRLSIWDVESLEHIEFLPEVDRVSFSALVVTPDGRTVVAGTYGDVSSPDPDEIEPARVVAWSLETGQELWSIKGGLQRIPYIPLAISHDGTTIIVGELLSFRVSLIDISTGEITRSLNMRSNGGHISRINTIDISLDDRQIITGSIGGSVVIWDIELGEPVSRLTGHQDQVTAVAFLPSGMSAISGAADGIIRVWDLSFTANVSEFIGHTKPVTGVDFLPTGEFALSSSGDLETAQSGDLNPSQGNQLILWNVETGTPERIFEDQPYPIITVDVSHDGTQALTGSFVSFGFGHMTLWDIESGTEIRSFDIPAVASVITSVSISPNGQYAVSGTFQGTVMYWDLTQDEPIWEMMQGDAPILTTLFHPDGDMILTTAGNGTAILWNAETGEEIRQFNADGPMVRSAVNHDGSLLITPITTGDLIVWDVETGEEIRHLVGHMGGGISVKFLPDDRYAISAGGDHKLILWDVETGDVVQRYSGHTDTLFDVAVSPDGRYAMSASGDRTLILWQLETQSVEDLVEWIKQYRYIPELSPTEKAQYGIQP